MLGGNSYTQWVVRPLALLPIEVWVPHPWRCRLIWSGGNQPVALGGPGWAVRSLSAQPCCDSMVLTKLYAH